MLWVRVAKFHLGIDDLFISRQYKFAVFVW